MRVFIEQSRDHALQSCKLETGGYRGEWNKQRRTHQRLQNWKKKMKKREDRPVERPRTVHTPWKGSFKYLNVRESTAWSNQSNSSPSVDTAQSTLHWCDQRLWVFFNFYTEPKQMESENVQQIQHESKHADMFLSNILSQKRLILILHWLSVHDKSLTGLSSRLPQSIWRQDRHTTVIWKVRSYCFHWL